MIDEVFKNCFMDFSAKFQKTTAEIYDVFEKCLEMLNVNILQNSMNLSNDTADFCETHKKSTKLSAKFEIVQQNIRCFYRS